ncbi:hypothetical protein I4F81_001197 [Pyropia yezoensis]|uniref:Uncharacterized protein n=1 Tax=Pyropia yezoensis TaxID=2788 RepID=A0ACC3BLH0_PYRYE|nr:hypothetical protein I4F81_001197 [Neopyropia yezoensis]
MSIRWHVHQSSMMPSDSTRATPAPSVAGGGMASSPAFLPAPILGGPAGRRYGGGGGGGGGSGGGGLTRCRPSQSLVVSATAGAPRGGGGGAPRPARADAVTAGAAAGLSPRAEALIARQREAPLFDPARLTAAAADDGDGGRPSSSSSSLGATASAAQAAGRFLTDDELRAAAASAATAAAAATLRDSVDGVIAAARAAVGAAHPGIFDAGGELHPPFRAAACWRDFWHFVRVATYAVAAGGAAGDGGDGGGGGGGGGGWTSDAGAAAMADLYAEMAVPLPAMVTGVRALGAEARAVVGTAEGEGGGEGVAAVDAAFGHLVARLESFV